MENIYGNQLKVLKLIYKKHKKKQYISKKQLAEELNLNLEEIIKICNLLVDLNYISLGKLELDPFITIQGIDYFSMKKSQNYETFMKSIFCPILVALITTLITLWLKGSL